MSRTDPGPPSEPRAPASDDPAAERFAPHASREMAAMFDDVSGKYDFLNRLMTLGRDAAWRAAMARAVPEDAATVLDLCTGNGVSLTRLRRPGRRLVGMDVSLGMLDLARSIHGESGWAPRFVAADAFHLPLGAGSVDAITVAFGVRNLRPRDEALAEMARVLRPGGTLAVLEAAAPRPGWFAPFHTFHLRHVVPLAGRLSSDPSAYAYLGRSILEFGTPESFDAALESAGFDLIERRRFLLGAAWLWVGRRREKIGRAAASGPAAGHASVAAAAHPPGDPEREDGTLQNARSAGRGRSELPQRGRARESEWRWWTGTQLAVSAALLAALIDAGWVLATQGGDLPLPPWERRGLMLLVAAGVAAFVLRTLWLLGRLLGPPPR